MSANQSVSHSYLCSFSFIYADTYSVVKASETEPGLLVNPVTSVGEVLTTRIGPLLGRTVVGLVSLR